jgi:RND family efflux transporter, MFP subunit
MKNYYFAALFLIIVLAVSFVGYGIYLNTQSNTYISTTQSRRLINVTGSTAEIREIYPESLLGTIALETESMVDVITQIEGTISAVTVEQGQEVDKGAILAHLENLTIPYLISRATANIKKAEAAYFQAKNNFERSESLRQKNVISLSEFEAANAQMAAAEAELTSAQVAMVELEQAQKYQELAAPIHGDILFIYRKTGSFVPKGTPVFMVGDFTTLVSHILLPAEKLAKHSPLDDEYELFIDLEDDLRAFNTNFTGAYDPDVLFPVRFAEIAPPLNEPAIYRQITLRIDNSKKILEPGLYVNTVLRKTTPVKTLVVPAGAFTDDEDRDVNSVDAEGRLKTVEVAIGVTDGEYVEVLQGLQAGDVVVTSNVTDLEDGTAVAVALEE